MDVRVGMIGDGFMGKAHANAWLKVNQFFDLPVKAVRQVVAARRSKEVEAFAKRWGWARAETAWERLVSASDVDLVDICTPNNVHAEMAIAATEAGKAVVCEKPLAMNLDEAKSMVKAAKKAGVLNCVCFNYRRVPAVGLARRLIEEGRLGRIFHIRAAYLQDWIIAPEFPLVWRLDKRVAGSGAHGDLNAHIIDMARFLVGEISEVVGDAKTFIEERPLPEAAMAGLATGKGSGKRGKVTVDDAVLFLARFANGAVGTFEATRFANGRKNANRIEINGEKGSLLFFFERMNELEFFSSEDPKHLQGWRTILATEPGEHPYISAWWPPGHIIGYEHTFINLMADVLRAYADKKDCMPDFEDAAKTQAVLDAVLQSARERVWVPVPRV